jgi:hypothetical protein
MPALAVRAGGMDDPEKPSEQKETGEKAAK